MFYGFENKITVIVTCFYLLFAILYTLNEFVYEHVT